MQHQECKERYAKANKWGGMIVLESTLKGFISSDFVNAWHQYSEGRKTHNLSKKNGVPCVVILKQGHFYITCAI